MARRFLEVVGFLALLGLAGAGVAALVLIPGKLSITVADEAAKKKEGPDPVALLRDEVASQRRDIAALADALGKNFEGLVAQRDEKGDARDAALAKATASLDAAVARMPDPVAADERQKRVADALTALAESVARLEKAVGRTGGAPVAAVPPASANAPPALPPPSSPPPIGSATALPPPRATGAAAPGPVAPASAPAATAGKRTSFLSFSLPSESFAYDQPQRFEVIPELSRVGFDAKSTLHDFSGVTSEVSGRFTARLSQPDVGSSGSVEAKTAAIDTGLADRDKDMKDLLEVSKFPSISFALASFRTTKSDPKAMTAEGTATGRMTIHGVARDVSFPLRLSVDESKRLTVEGEASIRLTDFGITPPSKMAVISMENEVRVWLNLRARSAGRADAPAGK